MCRVDFFLCGGRLYFNEINTVPGMTEASLYPLMLSESGVSPKDLAEQLVALAVARNDRRF
jgi:D-alanine-D-alanine ligase